MLGPLPLPFAAPLGCNACGEKWLRAGGAAGAAVLCAS